MNKLNSTSPISKQDWVATVADANSEVIKNAVTRCIIRLGIVDDITLGEYWVLLSAFDGPGKQILDAAMTAASLSTTRTEGETFDTDANQAQYRVVEPTLRGLLNCAEQIGGFGYEIPMKLRKSVPSPSRMKRVYYPSVGYNVRMMVDYSVRKAYRRVASGEYEGKAIDIHGFTNEELCRQVIHSYQYRNAKHDNANKRWDYVLHDDLDHGEFEEWRSIARALNKTISHMTRRGWKMGIKNKDALAQILMGLAAQVYIYWRDLRDNKYLRQ